MGVVDVKLQTPSDLARLVKNARVQRNLTQQDVADAVGITRQSLARLERGNGGTSFDTVLLILDHLGIHLDATAERRTTAPAAVATRGAAQAAADALAKRITPLIGSDAVEALNKQILGSLPQIDPSLLPKIDTSGILKQVEANLDPATLASIREASRGLTERLTIPGSVLINPPRAVEASPAATAEAEADADPDAAGGVE
jgi:transcriptional regulator with XRE-family HTH domain